jgi:hypothetical protein
MKASKMFTWNENGKSFPGFTRIRVASVEKKVTENIYQENVF